MVQDDRLIEDHALGLPMALDDRLYDDHAIGLLVMAPGVLF